MWRLNVSSKSNNHPSPMRVHVISSLFTCQGRGKWAAMHGGGTDCQRQNHSRGFGAKSLKLQTPVVPVRSANRNHPGKTSLVPSRNATVQSGPWGLLQCLPSLCDLLEIWTSWLCTKREEGLSYWKPAEMNTAQSYHETQQWKTSEVAKQKGMNKKL